MSIITLLNSKIKTNKYSNHDSEWERFVIDHRDYLLENSITRMISSAYMNQYQHNLKGYIRSINLDESVIWIIRFLNNLPTDREFKNISSIYIPSMQTIIDLYEQYQTTRA